MAQQVRCPCRGRSDCELCRGTGFYGYVPGPRGWMPFTCPTCKGSRVVNIERGGPESCFTCLGVGSVDPAKPPSAGGTRGWARNAWRFLFGG